MISLIKVSHFLFGIQSKQIKIPAGFETREKTGEWMRAIQGKKEFYIEEFQRFFRLIPIEKWPDGVEYARPDKAIRIGKE